MKTNTQTPDLKLGIRAVLHGKYKFAQPGSTCLMQIIPLFAIFMLNITSVCARLCTAWFVHAPVLCTNAGGGLHLLGSNVSLNYWPSCSPWPSTVFN